ncbi:MAG TPA: hypothetical protein VLA02_18715 [Reyranella sp.]|nr:hypothetical protein [Reyranella sp.]
MNRRAFVFASLAASAGVFPARAQADVQVIYIGGQDCPPCRRWRSTYHARWLASAEFQKVAWFEIEPMRLREAYEERNWPRALRPVLAQVARKSGTPRFLIVKDGEIVFNDIGVGKWDTMMATLKRLMG